MSFLDSIFEVDRSDATVFSYPEGEIVRMVKEGNEFEREQLIAEHEAIESARSFILTD